MYGVGLEAGRRVHALAFGVMVHHLLIRCIDLLLYQRVLVDELRLLARIR